MLSIFIDLLNNYMRHFTKSSFTTMSKVFRLNLINSCTGFKSANLIGTNSTDGISNVAVFSSVTHLGSNPPLLGFVLRPTTVSRNTYDNIKSTGFFTVNHINSSQIKDAHHSSAKYDNDISEFDKTNLEEEYLNDFFAPFVKDSKIKLACKFANEYHIKENDTLLLVASIEAVYLADELIQEDGWLNLDKANTVAINGLDGYAKPTLLDRFKYARPDQEIRSFFENGS
jgi:flavin reductase (DIM6/NTAB) family NADH-FMN oxidoreductase RutF